MSWPPSNKLVWFGVLGGPAAWAVQFVANLWLSYAECERGRHWNGPVDAWAVGLSVAALLIGLSAVWVCVRLYRHTAQVDGLVEKVRRGFGGRPPDGRIHFLAVTGLTVNFLSLMIVLMTAIGMPLLVFCQQS